MQAAARSLRLPLRNRAWRGLSGAWLGAGAGSSIDFQDHRPYLPGDDPRYIDWQAYARSGNYTMKLYREEVSPAIDLALDVSASMIFEEAKAVRTLELFYFALSSAQASRGAIRCYFVNGRSVTALPVEAALCAERLLGAFASDVCSPPEIPALGRISWRAGSLRVWISDLLYPGAPALHALAAARGRGVLLAPWCRTEGGPDWDGNVEFIECESALRRNQQVTPSLMAEYRRVYDAHFGGWREHARRLGVAFARVPAHASFLEALRTEALPKGAVEAVE